MITGKPISEIVMQALPYTLELTLSSVLIGAFLGVPIGIFTAMKRNSLIDYLGRIFSLAGLSVPAFYLGILIMLLFAIKLDSLDYAGALHDPVSATVFAQPVKANYTVVNGKFVIKEGQLVTIDEQKLIEKHNQAAKRLLENC